MMQNGNGYIKENENDCIFIYCILIVLYFDCFLYFDYLFFCICFCYFLREIIYTKQFFLYKYTDFQKNPYRFIFIE
jgi:hypothetical protein